MLSSQTAYVACLRCGHRIEEVEKHSKNLNGQWFREGAVNQYGELVEDESEIRTTKWATFWFEGVIAAYSSWQNLVYRYLNAEAIYEDSGDEDALISFINTRMGRSYILQSQGQDIGAHELMEKAKGNPYLRGVVPVGGRFLIMSIDVQGGKSNARFVVQAQVFGEGLQRWVIDRFEILTSPDRNGDRINPAIYAEDWELLIEQVIKKTYPVADGSGRVMKPILTLCDSGGSAAEKDGKKTSVTDFAYQFYNRLKAKGLSHLYRLVKGASKKDMDSLIKESYPDKRSKLAHGDEHTWTVSSRPSVMGNKKGFPNNRSLRQILSYLAKNPQYGEGKSIQITAGSGRELLNGMLRDQLVEIPFLKEDDFQNQKLFWGEINNFIEKPDGYLWLNYGSYAEPSLYLDKKLKEDVMRVYKLKSLERFRDSHFFSFWCDR